MFNSDPCSGSMMLCISNMADSSRAEKLAAARKMVSDACSELL
jgi:hypothetical protein